jgi:hypothetical protein
MIDAVELEVMNDNVALFGGEVSLPRGIYHGAIESMVLWRDGTQERVPNSALIQVDRAALEALGATIAPNLAAVDFGILSHIECGNIQVKSAGETAT